MGNQKVLKLKPDILDELDLLRYRRLLAYEKGEADVVTLINLEIKAFRLKHEWDEFDAHLEFLENQKEAAIPFLTLTGNDNIRYDLFDDDRNPVGLQLTINQLSKYCARRNFGIPHDEALLAIFRII